MILVGLLLVVMGTLAGLVACCIAICICGEVQNEKKNTEVQKKAKDSSIK